MSTHTLRLSLTDERGCTPCRDRVIAAVREQPGVLDAPTPRAGANALAVSFDDAQATPAALEACIEQARAQNAAQFEHYEARLTGMDCADCAMRIQSAAARVPDVTAVEVSLATEQIRFETTTGAGIDALRSRVEHLGYGFYAAAAPGSSATATHHTGDAPPRPTGPVAEWLAGSERITALATGALAGAVMADAASGPRALVIGLYLLSVLIGGVSIARSGIRAAIATRAPDMNLLMAIAVVGATAIGAWMEASLVVVLFSIGELLEQRAVGRARDQLASLIALTPTTARVLRAAQPEPDDHAHDHGGPGPHAHHQHGDHTHDAGTGLLPMADPSAAADACCGSDHAHAPEVEVKIPAEQLVPTDRLVVRPGEQIPADGEIIDGATAIDQAAVTGESVPVDRGVGDAVFAGTLNGTARIVVRVTSQPGDSTLDRIARLVREAQAQRSDSERWVTTFARRYTPAVVLLAGFVAVVLPAAGAVSWSTGLYSSLALLILACPCALVLSTPVTIVSALGRASQAGVLVKGGAYLEQAARVERVAFDKTGTLTHGKPVVTAVEATGSRPAAEVLAAAAAVELGSEHPLAAAIVAHARATGVGVEPAADVTALVGLGATGETAQGASVRVGDRRLFSALDPAIETIVDGFSARGCTAVVVEIDGTQAGAIALADQARPEAAEAIDQLRALGITDTLMLSGDNAGAAAAIAASIGITQVHAQLLPADKEQLVGALPGGTAMVGDGINDAPALARADLGVAMGTGGSDTAIEVADIALIGDDPRKLPGLIGLARWTRAVVQQNIAFSLGTKAIAALLLLAGALPLWGAVATDVGASLLVVANGLRVARTTPLGRARRLPLLTAAPAAATP